MGGPLGRAPPDLRDVREARDTLQPVAFSPDGRRVLAGDEKLVRVWDAETGNPLHTYESLKQTVQGVAVTPDGGHVLAAGRFGQTHVWEAGRDWLVSILGNQHLEVNDTRIALVGDRQVLSAIDDERVVLWDWKTRNTVRELPLRLRVSSLSVSPNGRLALVGGGRQLTLLDLTTWEYAAVPHGLGDVEFSEVRFTPDGRHFVTAHIGGAARLWRLPDDLASVPAPEPDRLELARSFPAYEPGWFARDVAVTPDGKLALSTGGRGGVHVFDLATGRRLRTYGDFPVNTLAVAPDGRVAAAGAASGDVHVFDPWTGERVKVLKGEPWSRGLDFSSNGRWLVSASGSGPFALHVWGVASGELLYQAAAPKEPHDVKISPNDRYVLVGGWDGGPAAYLWEPEAKTPPRKFLDGGWRDALAWLPDSRSALVGYKNGPIALVDVPGGTVRRRFTGHTNEPFDLEVLPGGRRFLSGSLDGTLRLWDVGTGEELGRVKTAGHGTNHVAVTSDGRTAVTGGGWHWKDQGPKADGDASLHVWRVPVR